MYDIFKLYLSDNLMGISEPSNFVSFEKADKKSMIKLKTMDFNYSLMSFIRMKSRADESTLITRVSDDL